MALLSRPCQIHQPLAPSLPDALTPNPYSDLLDLRGKRAVELGTGCGVAGMGLYLLGFTDLVLTDIATVMPALKINKPVLGRQIKYSILHWNNLDQIKALKSPFDFVIATDVVYIEESVGQLVSAMEALLADNQLRSPEADKLFWELCDTVFEIDKIPHEHLHPYYAYEGTDVYILRKKKKQN
ncbi:hypothetical protein L6164_022391 [Bauhinia variegata]|uniref:Uncharacterized protein n=1 Tax=Bauhinia variegata TaxID=167791 RepID=A0ACB9MEV9_BAUVA|nr:hypothetical protein L6164_022391 [Bauhinia variegata]